MTAVRRRRPSIFSPAGVTDANSRGSDDPRSARPPPGMTAAGRVPVRLHARLGAVRRGEARGALEGPSTATLTLLTNAATAPASVSLSGTGGSLPQGALGQPGATGPKGATGAKGARGPAGKIEPGHLQARHAEGQGPSPQHTEVHRADSVGHGQVHDHERGRARDAGAPRRLYARGVRVAAKGGGALLVLNRTRRFVRGAYTLTLRHRRGRGWVTSRSPVALR